MNSLVTIDVAGILQLSLLYHFITKIITYTPQLLCLSLLHSSSQSPLSLLSSSSASPLSSSSSLLHILTPPHLLLTLLHSTLQFTSLPILSLLLLLALFSSSSSSPLLILAPPPHILVLLHSSLYSSFLLLLALLSSTYPCFSSSPPYNSPRSSSFS